MVANLDNLSNRSRDDHDFYTVINFSYCTEIFTRL